jgi:D-xylose transport system substrate-binding protein
VPDWNNEKGGVIFEQMFTKQGGKIDGVAAANDGLANAAIAVLKKNKVNGQVPITGQDATVEGLQNILAGDQCMTVYKAIKKEAEAASNFAAKLARGEDASADASAKVNDSEGKRDVPSVLLEPQAIFKENVKDVIADGFQTKEAVCTGDFAAKCTEAGIS